MAMDFVHKEMDTTTLVLNSFLYISAAPQECFELVGKKMMRSMRAVLVLVAAVLVCIWGNNHMASADTSPSECKEERNVLVSACRPVLRAQPMFVSQISPCASMTLL